jgi:hypothetical protein
VVQEEVEGEEILDLVVVVVVEEEGEDLMTRTSSQYQQTSVDWLLEKVANRDVLLQRCLLLWNFCILHGFSVENTGYGFVPETTVSAQIRILKHFSCSKNWFD